MRLLNNLQRQAAKLIYLSRRLEADIRTIKIANEKPYGKYSLGFKECEDEAKRIPIKIIDKV